MTDPKKARRPKAPSASQLRALDNLANGRGVDGHCRTMSDHGGLHATMCSLYANDWTTARWGEITEAGRAALAKAQGKTNG